MATIICSNMKLSNSNYLKLLIYKEKQLFHSMYNINRIFYHRICFKKFSSHSFLNSNSQISLKITPDYVKFKKKLNSGPSLEHFLANIQNEPLKIPEYFDNTPYVDSNIMSGKGRKVYFEVYGCQMNVNDTEIIWSILQKEGYQKTDIIEKADVILVITCAIREGAEEKIWKRFHYFKHLKKTNQRHKKVPLKVGILGCMAERLKEKIVEKEKLVDLVAGPDAYKDLPKMLAITESGQRAVNVILSLDETYADVIPVRLNTNAVSAFVSIMRGCDNMCSYCIVPYTRGRERSRPISSILEEVKILSEEGVKEVILLGQNVNSYRDTSVHNFSTAKLSKGFNSVKKLHEDGLRFSDLLDKVSQINPNMRIRFTSAHPKDFPDEVLHLIQDRPNICKQLHLPAQSGNSEVLMRMERGYSRETYLELVDHIRSIIPDVALTSDFIAGFCGETKEEHEDTLSLLRLVQYNYCYVFPYSMREKTRAHLKLQDNVLLDEKKQRALDLLSVFRQEADKINKKKIGSNHLVLVEGESKRSPSDLAGRNDSGTKVIFPKSTIPVFNRCDELSAIKAGDYVVVKIEDASSQVLKGTPLYHSSINNFNNCLGSE